MVDGYYEGKEVVVAEGPVHVSKYVWDCAHAILGEKSKSRSDWDRKMLEDLLDGETQKVINELQQVVDKKALSSAFVESNCKHLVKDRMELSGMRCPSQGVQNMMDIRAVKLMRRRPLNQQYH